MAVAVRIELHQWQINAMLRRPNGLVGRNMQWRGRRVQRRAQRNVNSRTGRLAASITVSVKTFGGAAGVEVGSSLHYAQWVHDGTGVYGRHGRPIVSPRGRYMRFVGASGSVVFARSVSGQRPNPFLARALHAAV